MDFIQEEKEDFRKAFNRFRKRDFSGTSGQALKNSSLEISNNLVVKAGSFLFTIIIARMLLPELFGLYSLALGTIILFASFADLGMGSAAITYISRKLSQNKPLDAKKYFKTLLKWKIFLSLFASILIVSLSYYLANSYYNKPIFFALLTGGLYLPVITLTNFLTSVFKASNDFKRPLIKEIFLQILKLTIVPLGIFLILKMSLKVEIMLLIILGTLIFCYLLSFFLLIYLMEKKLAFLKAKNIRMKKSEKKNLIKFILPLSAIVLSGAFFGYIDMFMLGHYVSSEFISYYSSSFNLIAAASVLVGSFAVALFPLFSRVRGKSLQNLLRKSRNAVFVLSLFAAIFTIFAAYWVIKIIYGESFLPATLFLQFFSVLIVILPIIAIYNNYYVSQRKTSILAFILIGSTILTIILNLIGINYGLRFSEYYAVLGACIATIISKLVCLLALFAFRKK